MYVYVKKSITYRNKDFQLKRPSSDVKKRGYRNKF